MKLRCQIRANIIEETLNFVVGKVFSMEGVEKASAIRTLMKERVRNVRKVHLRLLAIHRTSPYVYSRSYML